MGKWADGQVNVWVLGGSIDGCVGGGRTSSIG